MTEADWLKARNPEAMLRLVADRLSPRQWHLLACGHARRVLDGLPDEHLAGIVDWVERNAGRTSMHPELAARLDELTSASQLTVEAARSVQREIVLAADPDADPEAYDPRDNRQSGPAVPLFREACRAAGTSVRYAGETAADTFTLISTLIQSEIGAAWLTAFRQEVVRLTVLRGIANLQASLALKLKALGDEVADVDSSRTTRHRLSIAETRVQQEEEHSIQKQDSLRTQKAKADLKAHGRILHDLAGNPFKPYRFEPAWRTDAVVGLARAIDHDRAFDRMPILADALLDADCDEEAVLRHCRGTEHHAKDGPAHGRGCWVIDLILEAEPGFFSAAPVSEPAARPASPARRRRPPADGWAQLFEAVRQIGPPDPERGHE
jgi:hypothetical protein